MAVGLVQRCDERLSMNHTAMDAGLPHDTYLKLVGRNQQLTEFKQWVSEEFKKAEVHDDDDS